MNPSDARRAALAAHRFGLGEAAFDAVGDDAAGWLEAQIGPADAAVGPRLADTREALAAAAALQAARARARAAPPPASGAPAPEPDRSPLREINAADARSRLATAVASRRPFAERMALFWANHFTVSTAKNSAQGLVGSFEREAIRPHIAGRFGDLLFAATTHPAMLRYLDNSQSAGPDSRVARRFQARAAAGGEAARVTGLNENLAREVLELHTLGAAASAVPGGYTQADVSAFAAVLTGWRPAPADADVPDGAAPALFNAAWHQPGEKTVLGRRYPEGPDALRAVLADLARHPATARHLATRLARHLVADVPPPALVDRLAAAYRDSDGQLGEVYRTLIASPEAWDASPAKLKTPEEFVVSTVRVLGLGTAAAARLGPGTLAGLGQRPLAAPSPAGWSDSADDWLGPDAVWKRVEWSLRLASGPGKPLDARAIAEASLGPLLRDATRSQLARAADGQQALALLLMAPEFQRR